MARDAAKQRSTGSTFAADAATFRLIESPEGRGDGHGYGNGMGRHRRLRVVTVLAVLIGLVSALVPTFPAAAQPPGAGFIGTDFTSYGGNAVITASGVIDYVTSCPAGGINDYVNSAADVYLLRGHPTISGGASIKALAYGGQPTTTIQSDSTGGFFGETIGFTRPQGTIPSGTWSIVLDECQDGIFHSTIDEVAYDVFTVTVKSNVPSNPDITALKADATAQAQNWQSALQYATTVQKAQQIKETLSKIQKMQPVIDALLSGVDFGGALTAYSISQLLDQASNVTLGPYNAAKAAAIAGANNALANTAKHWQELANDPPDPNYQQVTVPPSFPTLAADTADAPTQASASLGTQAGIEASLTQAFVDALQRYEGAQAAGDGAWALIHAREV